MYNPLIYTRGNDLHEHVLLFQLAYSAILSTLYTLLQMIVFIGLLKEAASAGFCSVTTVFLALVAGIFLVSAIMHPQVC